MNGVSQSFMFETHGSASLSLIEEKMGFSFCISLDAVADAFFETEREALDNALCNICVVIEDLNELKRSVEAKLHAMIGE